MIVSGQDNQIALGVKTSFFHGLGLTKSSRARYPPGPFLIEFKYRAKQALEGNDRGSRQ
jgi:hypothetical protein